jgi:hypothetical protein
MGKEGRQMLPRREALKWHTPRVGRSNAAREHERVREEVQSLLHDHHGTSANLDIFAERITDEEHH